MQGVLQRFMMVDRLFIKKGIVPILDTSKEAAREEEIQYNAAPVAGCHLDLRWSFFNTMGWSCTVLLDLSPSKDGLDIGITYDRESGWEIFLHLFRPLTDYDQRTAQYATILSATKEMRDLHGFTLEQLVAKISLTEEQAESCLTRVAEYYHKMSRQMM
jgi:hypothetical protein